MLLISFTFLLERERERPTGVNSLKHKTDMKMKFQEEQLAILRKKPQGAALTLEDLNSMSYGLKVTISLSHAWVQILTSFHGQCGMCDQSNADILMKFQVAKETLRMSNVLLWYPRVAITDCTIEGKSTLSFVEKLYLKTMY